MNHIPSLNRPQNREEQKVWDIRYPKGHAVLTVKKDKQEDEDGQEESEEKSVSSRD